jgi:hypothetical protein
VDLGERLGYERPEKIRDLIRGLLRVGKLNGSDIFTAAGKNEDPLGRGRPATEFWLTEAKAQ